MSDDEKTKRLTAFAADGLSRIAALQADNARLREKLADAAVALDAAGSELSDFANCLSREPWAANNAYEAAIYARAVLNPGKEVMPSDNPIRFQQADIGPGDQAVAGAALDCVCGMGFGPCKYPECKAPILAQKGDSRE